MSWISPLPFYRGNQAFLIGAVVGVLCGLLSAGCAEVEHHHGGQPSNPYLTSDTRHPIPLSSPAGKEHRAVMLQHLETLQVIMNALVEEDYELAKGLTESHLGFFMHRHLVPPAQSDARQQQPGQLRPSYVELAQAHQAAAEELVHIIPTKDLKQILPQFNNVLKACVACHLEYKLRTS